jgi:hypothetical protein
VFGVATVVSVAVFANDVFAEVDVITYRYFFVVWGKVAFVRILWGTTYGAMTVCET